jgi:hypothetical protein
MLEAWQNDHCDMCSAVVDTSARDGIGYAELINAVLAALLDLPGGGMSSLETRDLSAVWIGPERERTNEGCC